MRDLTTGSVTRALLQTASFMLVSMVFQTLYFLADLYWVGRLSKEAVAAVGVAGNLMFVVFAVSQMLGVGTTTLISHAVGRGDQEHALEVFNQSQVLSILMALVLLALTPVIVPAYSQGLSADPETARLAHDYLRWFVPSMALQFGVIAMGAALRGTGNFMPGMIVQSVTVILNIVLAPILIFGWWTGRPHGVAGAAMATLISVAIGVLWLLCYFLPRTSYLRFLRSHMKPRADLWGAMLKIGLPAGAEFGLMAVYLAVVYTISKPFGSAAQAGFGIGMRIMQAGFMPVVALGFSVAPVAGQNFGARRADRVRETMRVAIRIAVIAMAVFAIACHIAPRALIGIFSKDPQVLAQGEEYLRIVSWNFVCAGVVFVSSSMFQAIGNTVPSLISSFVRLTVAVVPALIFSRMAGFQLYWIWYLGVASVTLQMIVSLLMLRGELRKRLNCPAPVETPVAAAAS